MRSTAILVLLFLITGPWCIANAKNHPCPQKLSLELVNAQVLSDNHILAGGRNYPPEAYWKDGTRYFGCPCLNRQCLRKCPANFNSGGIKEVEHRTPFNISVSHHGQDLVVNGHEHFDVIEGDVCEINNTIPLEPEDDPHDAHKILSNGSLHYTHSNSVEEGPEHFCVLISEDGTYQGVAVCLPPGDGLPPNKQKITSVSKQKITSVSCASHKTHLDTYVLSFVMIFCNMFFYPLWVK